jgi:hypothetical protein
VGIRERLRHLEAAAEAELIVIPQRDGTVARFPQSEGIEAYVNWFDRMGAGENAPPEHLCWWPPVTLATPTGARASTPSTTQTSG